MSTYFLNPFEEWEPFAELTKEKNWIKFQKNMFTINLLIEM